MRVIVAMSGGVDSSVAAARLLQFGHEVIGLTLKLWGAPDATSEPGGAGVSSPVHDAARVAERLGVPHHVIDGRAEFEREIVAPFVAAYLAGLTPSPCVSCNRRIKLAALERLRCRLGADAVATGHYARVQRADGRARLFRALDRRRDQSYFLHALDVDALDRLLLPLGELTKSEVREQARRLGLPGAERPDSQELCFVPDGRYVALVEQRGAERICPGPLVDESGREVGRHRGIHAFTIGQRRALGVALGTPCYVTRIDPVAGRVTLGPREHLLARGASLLDVVLADDVELPARCEVAVRHGAKLVPCVAEPAALGGVTLHFAQPVAAVVPGQYAVLYAGDRVLGGGRIQAPLPAA